MYTNTTPVDAYRGAGRPEATFMVEYLIDRAGRTRSGWIRRSVRTSQLHPELSTTATTSSPA